MNAMCDIKTLEHKLKKFDWILEANLEEDLGGEYLVITAKHGISHASISNALYGLGIPIKVKWE